MLYTLGAVAVITTPGLAAWGYFQHGDAQLRLYAAAALMLAVAVIFFSTAKFLEVREHRRYSRSRESLSYSSAR